MKHLLPDIILNLLSHAPHGACGLKLVKIVEHANQLRHAPHGACGLKHLTL